MKCSLTVGISTHGKRQRWLQDAIESMYYYNNDVSFNLVVVDNASEDDTLEYLSRLSICREIIVIPNSRNLDDTLAMNQVLATVSTDYFLKVDSDVIFRDHGAIRSSIALIEELKVSILGPYWDLSLTRKDEIWNWQGFERVKAMLKKATLSAQAINQHFEITIRLPRGNYLLMKMADIVNIGGFDDNYKHNAMEYPLVMRLMESGLDYAEFNACSVIHKPSDEERKHMRKNVPHMF